MDKTLKIRCTDEEKRMLEELAEHWGFNSSQYIRYRIRQDYKELKNVRPIKNK